jgi:methionyl-tRNA formyltransferase
MPLAAARFTADTGGMRITFLGAGEFGLPTLRALHASHDVVMVVSQPDRPAGRKRVLTPTAISRFAGEHGLPLLKPDNVNEPDVMAKVHAADADAMVIVAFGQYLKQALVDQPRLGAMNLHASLLPRWRGASPINATLLNGDAQAGNTIIRIAKQMDAGAMLGQQSVDVDPLQTAGELHDHLAAMGPTLVFDVLEQLEAGTAQEVEQDDHLATLAPKLSKADGYVDWQQDATTIRQRVHGLTPWPGVTAFWAPSSNGGDRHRLQLRRVEDLPQHSHAKPPGTLISDTGLVAAATGAVRLLEVQPPGKRTMTWDDYARGHNIVPGAMFHRSE